MLRHLDEGHVSQLYPHEEMGHELITYSKPHLHALM